MKRAILLTLALLTLTEIEESIGRTSVWFKDATRFAVTLV